MGKSEHIGVSIEQELIRGASGSTGLAAGTEVFVRNSKIIRDLWAVCGENWIVAVVETPQKFVSFALLKI